MIYTCYEMIRDCRADRPEGWSHLIASYTPAVQKLIGHYSPARASDAALLERVLRDLRRPESSLFQSLEPSPERWFVAELRQRVLAAIVPAENGPEASLDLETLAAALDPLTVIEKEAVWLETMRYSAVATGTLLRMDPKTVEKIRDRAAELLRSKVDTWCRTLLSGNGALLGRAAAAASTAACPPSKTFLDVLDGRATWRGRDELEAHVRSCWHCIDHFCRMAEVIELLRGIESLPQPEHARLCQVLGIPTSRRSGWKRWFTAS